MFPLKEDFDATSLDSLEPVFNAAMLQCAGARAQLALGASVAGALAYNDEQFVP